MNTFVRFGMMVVMLIAFVACGAATPAATPTPAPMPVKIQLSWIHEYSSSPFYAAIRNGHFAANGVEATLTEGGFDDQGYIDPVAQVISGNTDFAMADGASLIQARAAGSPVVALASMMQRNPLAILSLSETGSVSPQDLAGKSVSVASGGAELMLNTLLQSQGVDRSTVNVVGRTNFGIEPLVNGEVDNLVAWITNEGVALQEQGLTTNTILMSDYAVDAYDFVLFTTEAMINDKPDVVRGVVHAVQMGIADVIADPAQAVEYTLSFKPELVAAEQLRRLEASIPLMNVPGKTHGGMEATVWQFTYDMLVNQGILTQTVDLAQVYTLDFIDADNE